MVADALVQAEPGGHAEAGGQVHPRLAHGLGVQLGIAQHGGGRGGAEGMGHGWFLRLRPACRRPTPLDNPPPARDTTRQNRRGRAMAELPISAFPIPDIASLPEDVRERILAVQEKAGFVPNVFLMLAYRPDEFRAFMAYHDALMDKREGLTAAEREMIVVAVSSANQCQYCVVAH